jgi:hypothetical protein
VINQELDQKRIIRLFMELAEKYGKFDAIELFEEALELADGEEE